MSLICKRRIENVPRGRPDRLVWAVENCTTTSPFKIDIDAPVQITLAPSTGPFGQKGFKAIDGQFIRNEMAINSASLDSLRQAKEEIQEAAQEAAEEIQKLKKDANQMLDRVFGQ